jgi:hypothetical protein
MLNNIFVLSAFYKKKCIAPFIAIEWHICQNIELKSSNKETTDISIIMLIIINIDKDIVNAMTDELSKLQS